MNLDKLRLNLPRTFLRKWVRVRSWGTHFAGFPVYLRRDLFELAKGEGCLDAVLDCAPLGAITLAGHRYQLHTRMNRNCAVRISATTLKFLWDRIGVENEEAHAGSTNPYECCFGTCRGRS